MKDTRNESHQFAVPITAHHLCMFDTGLINPSDSNLTLPLLVFTIMLMCGQAMSSQLKAFQANNEHRFGHLFDYDIENSKQQTTHHFFKNLYQINQITS